MTYKELSSLDIFMPEVFPTELHDIINDRVSKKKDDYFKSWSQFAGGWSAVAYRFLSCTEYNENFTLLVKKFGNAPRQPWRYIQERELFNFFVTGLSVIESICYALYAIASILDEENFPITTDNHLRTINIKSTKEYFEKSELLKNENIINVLNELIENQDYKDWKDIRNILAHRSQPGRQFFAGAENHGKALWIKGIQINENTSNSRYKWLTNKSKKLIKEIDIFISHHFKNI